jgi:hypothetical protein
MKTVVSGLMDFIYSDHQIHVLCIIEKQCRDYENLLLKIIKYIEMVQV